MMAAAKEKRVAAVALVAAVGTTGADLNLYQVTHALERSNRPQAERQATIELQRQIQQAVITGKGWETIAFRPPCGNRPTHPGSRAFSPTIRQR